MEIYQIKYLLALAEELNFSRASEKLCITQSALSQQIKKFEKELGFRVFERDTKSVRLTSDGAEFLAYAQRVDAEYERMEQWLQNRKKNRYQFSFGASEYSELLIAGGLEAFRGKYQSVRVEMVRGGSPVLIDMVKYKMLDLALAGLPDNKAIRSGLRVFPIRTEYLCAVVSETHPLRGRKSVSMQEFAGDKIIMRSHASRIYFEVTREFNRHGIIPNISIVEDFGAQFREIGAGAVTFAKSNAIIYERNHLRMIRVEPEISTEFAIITSGDHKLSAIENDFIKTISDFILETPQCGQS